jgi:hypothetical protein
MATRNKDFPITIKAGSSAVKIYKETKPNGEYYRVCYYIGGKRERLTFSSLEEAKTEARLKAALLARGDSAALELTGQDRLVYGRAIDAVRPFNPSSAVQKVLLLILNNLRCFSAVFLHYILHRFRTAWQT